MLGQIRRHIAKKNEKLFYIFVLFIVAFGISIVHYMFLEKESRKVFILNFGHKKNTR
mgnify:CR=1 FL=1